MKINQLGARQVGNLAALEVAATGRPLLLNTLAGLSEIYGCLLRERVNQSLVIF